MALWWSEWVGRGAIRLPEAAAVWLSRPRVEPHIIAVWLFMVSSRAPFVTINLFALALGNVGRSWRKGICSHIQ